jgi:hypothetical protein
MQADNGRVDHLYSHVMAASQREVLKTLRTEM